MKYQVQISYTNPAHEHISLRRRVDTVTRIVEARTEQEALNRAANQQRALGFMIKEAKVVKPAVLSEELEQVGEATGEHPAIQKFAAIQHDNWRKGFDPEGTGKERIKKNSDGTEGNINVPFHKLHPDWQKENLAAGRAAHAAIQKHPNDIEKASEHVHNEWMKRNPKADYNAHQHVPYNDLPEDEKEKDREHVRTMHKLVNVNEGFDKDKPQPKLPAGEKYTVPKKPESPSEFSSPTRIKPPTKKPYFEEVEQIDEGGHIYTKHSKTGELHRVGSFKEMPLGFYNVDDSDKPSPSAKETEAALAKRNPHLDPEHIKAIRLTSGQSNKVGKFFINHNDNSVGRKYIKQELGIREEVEQVDELNYEYNMKRLPPKGFTVPHQQNPHLHYNPKTKQVHNTRTGTTYPDYGNEFVGYRMQKNEEVEQVDEVKLNTAVRALGQMKKRADDYYSSPEDKKRVNRFQNTIARKFGEKGAAVADKVSSNVGNVERHSNPGDALGRRDQPKITPDSVMQKGGRRGKLRPDVLKHIKRLQKAKLYSLTSTTKPNLPEEVEQVDEANMRFDPEAAARPTSRDVKNFQMRDTNRRAAAASKKYIRRMTKLGGLGPNQTKKDTERHMMAHFGEETGADKRDAGYKMSPAVRAAQKKSDELSKEKPKHQAGTLAAKNVREEKANVNNSKDKLKLLKDRVKNKIKTANMMPSLDITGK